MRFLASIDSFFERYFPLWSLPIFALVLIALMLLTRLYEPDPRTVLVHSIQSSFQKIVVFDQAGLRCLRFGDGDTPRQSCISLEQPQYLILNYSRMLLGALYLNPHPRKVLIIGLGGGIVPRALVGIVPEAEITSVELDPAVASIAQAYFKFTPTVKQQIVISDGRKFIETALSQGQHYDLIMLDAFDANYIPLNLMSQEFLQSVKALLSEDGVIAANTFTSSALYSRESTTYAAVFGPFYNLKFNNRIILAKKDGLPSLAQIKETARQLDSKLKPLGVDTEWLTGLFSTTADWDVRALPLKES